MTAPLRLQPAAPTGFSTVKNRPSVCRTTLRHQAHTRLNGLRPTGRVQRLRPCLRPKRRHQGPLASRSPQRVGPTIRQGHECAPSRQRTCTPPPPQGCIRTADNQRRRGLPLPWTPYPPGSRFHCGKKCNVQKEILIWAIFGSQTFGFQTLPPPPSVIPPHPPTHHRHTPSAFMAHTPHHTGPRQGRPGERYGIPQIKAAAPASRGITVPR